jgi:hypothetical protein
MEEVSNEIGSLQLENSTLTLTSMPVSSVVTVSGPGGKELFRIKPDGEFVPGPGVSESEAISEAARTFYKNMTIFGKSFSETLASKDERIRELEKQLEELRNGSQY